MTGPRPAGRPWTLTDDDMLRELLASGVKPRLIAQKLKRSIGAIQTRIYLFKKPRKRLAPNQARSHVGTIRTSSDVRSTVATEGKPDMTRTAQFGRE